MSGADIVSKEPGLFGQSVCGKIWPWGKEYRPELCNGNSTDTVETGNYPDGASVFGCLDMSGNTWEWTESECENRHTRYAVLKGGSYFIASGSIKYTASGAQPCAAREKMILMAPSMDRCSTIGFRCVKDVEVK
jgi:formylglycine-generating enzyme required for sulfatase activity